MGCPEKPKKKRLCDETKGQGLHLHHQGVKAPTAGSSGSRKGDREQGMGLPGFGNSRV